MIRLLILVAVLLALGIGAAWLADNPGWLQIDWQGYRIETSGAVGVILLLFLAVLLALLYQAAMLLRRGPRSFGLSRQQARQRRGYAALTRGLLAVAAGDGAAARRLAAEAERLLDDPAPILLLTAQAAELNGDEAMADRTFHRMLSRPETEFLGLRGLLAQAVRRGQKDRALALARRAESVKPDAIWLMRERLALEAAIGDWRAAGETLERSSKRKALEPAELLHQRAVIALARARQSEQEGLDGDALDWALKAAKAEPGFAPAQVEAARRLNADGKRRKAARLLAAAWARQPHPAVGHAYLDLFADEEPRRRWLRAEELVAGALGHPESKALLAEATVAAGDAKAARPLVLALKSEEGETDRVCRLMAAVERAEWGDSQAARDWLAKSHGAPKAGAWTCRTCGGESVDWRPHCPHCEAFASLSWGAAGQERAKAASLAQATQNAAANAALAQTRPPPYRPAASGKAADEAPL